jgi:hypothetical protein
MRKAFAPERQGLWLATADAKRLVKPNSPLLQSKSLTSPVEHCAGSYKINSIHKLPQDK